MRQSRFSYTYELARAWGTTYSIGVRADPSTTNPDSWAVVLYFALEDGTRVQVAKVDNAVHDGGDVHVDRYYREPGVEVKDFEVGVDGYVDAERFLQANWERLARLYREHHGHGHGAREDGKNV